MLSLIRLLLTRSYWQMLFRPHTWKNAFLNLRRFHKDRRARKQFGQFLYLISIPMLVGAYVAILLGRSAVFLLPVLIAIALWQGRRAKEAAKSLSILPDNKPVRRELSAEERAEIRKYLADLALFYAVLLNRSGSEGYLKTKVVPEGVEVISRRVHLELLRSRNIWDRLSSADREALMAADGHWQWEQINMAVLAGERVRLLRWMLRIDSYLPVVGQQLKVDYKAANSLIDAPESVYSGKELISLEGLERGQEAAAEYFYRCYAEGLVRGYFEASSEQQSAWAADVCARMGGRQHEDLLLDTRLVSEAPEETLRWAAELAHQRHRFLGWAGTILNGDERPQQFPQFLAAKQAEEFEGEAVTA
ncbi:hypothetical protein [Silvibacterium dinghuense]|uniref:DUF1266 domain-containing protein n=1 Tax=Silvibacterium dinghuense TaxID=1560006 RepID=A0A4Q1SI38_9BACT|nr:hypothetical protein [Silvibacterium dinghuense]RXS97047.1 hypothetical protein ESZ00_03715 [Silvibacterium dinghuense]GGG95755.1 hypothetical protein GCM10011586_08540 [Silvibacterium dinghuense]